MITIWHEISLSKVRAYQFGDEPEVIYLIKQRDNEYMVVHEDAYDINTGTVEFISEREVMLRYGIH